jgi:hypothetical protein
MPDQNAPTPVTISFGLELKDFLFAAWAGYLQRRRRMKLISIDQPPRSLRDKARENIAAFVAGLCLGIFHVYAAGLVLIAAANALGYLPPLSPDDHRYIGPATIVIGLIWLALLSGESLEKSRNEAACKRLWRQDFPDILRVSVPVSINFMEGSFAIAQPGSSQTVTELSSVKLVEADAYFLLQLGGARVPMAKSKLSSQALNHLRGWSTSHEILFNQAPVRPRRLPPRIATWLGAALCLSCLWAGTHIKTWPKPAPYPTTVRLALRDVATMVAGQVVTLQKLSYTASGRQGGLSDQLSVGIGRPEISGTFTVDRIATPYLAQTAQAEFNEARTWHLWSGQIPADATMELLPESGVLITWDNPPTANYPGHCAILRANGGTIPVSGGRFLWRYRLRIQACSASMSQADVRDWMLAAIQPLDNELALRTQTNPSAQ